MKRILLISRCPPYPLHLGDRLIIYHLARELSQRGYAIDLLAFANPEVDAEELTRAGTETRPYTSYFQEIELFHEPRRSQFDYLKRALFPAARWPRKAEDSWSPEMWQTIERRLGGGDLAGRPYTPPYDVVHLFGGIQVYEFYHALHDTPAIIVPYESYSLYLRRLVEHPHPPTPSPILREGERTREHRQTLKRPAAEEPSPLKGLKNFQALAATLKTILPSLQRSGKGSWSVRLASYAQLAIARRFERWMFVPYRRVVVVSQRDRDELLGLNPDLKIEVIPNGIDLSYFQPRDQAREPATLLLVGNYEYAPNVDAALRLAHEILPQVQARIPSVKLWLVGHGPPAEVQALASDTITVTGSVPDVRPYLAQATAFVSPLRLGAGIKNKVLEALAMGCPVVATPLSVDGIDVQHRRDVLVADGSAMVGAIVNLLEDQDVQRRLSENGRRLIEEQYSWAHVAAMYEELYKAVKHVGN